MSQNDLDWLHLKSAQRHLLPRSVVYHAGDAFHSIFAVRSGICKTVAICTTGQEKIIAFHLPGEIFGLAGITSGRYTYGAVALTETHICAVPYADLQRVCRRNPQLQHALFKVISSAMSWHRMLLERTESLSAEARVISWLFNLSERYARCGYSPDHFPMAMTRVEAGNYLGLTPETVTRILRRLERTGMIEVTQKSITIKSRGALLERVDKCLGA